MRRAWLVLPLLLALPACASGPFARPSATMLAKADRLAEQGNYEAAVAAYDKFLAAHADDSEAGRARMSRETAAAVVSTRAEITRLRQELARVREDLERLKEIDLRLEKRNTK